MNLRLSSSFIALIFAIVATAQESGSVFNFLSLPTSAHATALSGQNISAIADDAALAAHNPALLASVSENSLYFQFLTYMRGCKAGGAGFVTPHSERGTWGVHTQFAGYGKMKETNMNGEILGTTSALDFCVSGQYSYALSDRIVGGATGKFIYSGYAGYTSIAMAVDLGLNYYNADNDFSFSAVAANLGGQIKAFGDTHERLPFNLQLGISKRFGHSPVTIHASMVDITRWGKKNYFTAGESIKGAQILINHFNVGVDVTPIPQLYIAAGYNFRRAYEMKAAGSSRWAGLSLGAGINIKKIKLGIAYAKYHVSAHTMHLNIAYSI